MASPVAYAEPVVPGDDDSTVWRKLAYAKQNAGPVPPSFVGPLDSVAADCLFAYATGVRLFSESDPTWTIRRASDSVTQDFTTDPTTGVWGSDVLAFLGAAQGVVAASVDQKTGLTLTQAGTTLQPEMATGGALTQFNSGNFGTLHTLDNLVSSTAFSAIPQPFTVFVRIRPTLRTNNAGPFSMANGFVIAYNGTNWVVRYNAGSVQNLGVAVALNTVQTARLVFNGATSTLHIDGSLATSFDLGSSANATSSAIRVGLGVIGGFTGSYAFAGIWAGAKTDGTIETLLSTIWP